LTGNAHTFWERKTQSVMENVLRQRREEIRREVQRREFVLAETLEKGRTWKTAEEEETLIPTLPSFSVSIDDSNETLRAVNELECVSIQAKKFLERRARMRQVETKSCKNEIKRTSKLSKESAPEFVKRLQEISLVAKRLERSKKEAWKEFVEKEITIIQRLVKRNNKKSRASMALEAHLKSFIYLDSSKNLDRAVERALILAERVTPRWGSRHRAFREKSEMKRLADDSHSRNVKETIENALRARERILQKAGMQSRALTLSKDDGLWWIMSSPLSSGSTEIRKRILHELGVIVEKIDLNRLSRTEIKHRYHMLLAECAFRSLIASSWLVYRSMLQKMPEAIGFGVFRLLLTACKNPASGNELSLNACCVLQEMENVLGTSSLNLEIVNSALDSCSPQGDWRTAIRLLKLLQSKDIQLNRTTLKILTALCTNTSLDNATTMFDEFSKILPAQMVRAIFLLRN